jgi:hypothetical protein
MMMFLICSIRCPMVKASLHVVATNSVGTTFAERSAP